MKFKFNIFLSLILISFFNNIFSLAKDTKVLNKDGLISIQDLAIGQTIIGYNLDNNSSTSILKKYRNLYNSKRSGHMGYPAIFSKGFMMKDELVETDEETKARESKLFQEDEKRLQEGLDLFSKYFRSIWT